MFPEPMVAQLATVTGLVGALSEGQRAIAHVAVLVAVAVIAGLVFLMRRVRRSNRAGDGRRSPTEER